MLTFDIPRPLQVVPHFQQLFLEMLNKKQASQFILKIFELAGLFVSLGVPLNKIRLNGKMENYPVIPTDQYLTSRTQNTPALPYFFRSSLSSSTMPLSSE